LLGEEGAQPALNGEVDLESEVTLALGGEGAGLSRSDQLVGDANGLEGGREE
jgi:hypothetical protein